MTLAPHDTSADGPDPARAAELLEGGLGRRGFVRAALATGALLAAGTAVAGPAAAAPGTAPGCPGRSSSRARGRSTATST